MWNTAQFVVERQFDVGKDEGMVQFLLDEEAVWCGSFAPHKQTNFSLLIFALTQLANDPSV